MYNKLIQASLFLLGVVLVCIALMTTKKNSFRVLLSAIIVVLLLLVNQHLEKEKEKFAVIDSKLVSNNDSSLLNQQRNTSNELTVLEEKIKLMKRFYVDKQNKINESNTPTIKLRCSPPIDPEELINSNIPIESGGFSVIKENVSSLEELVQDKSSSI